MPFGSLEVKIAAFVNELQTKRAASTPITRDFISDAMKELIETTIHERFDDCLVHQYDNDLAASLINFEDFNDLLRNIILTNL